MLIIVDEISRRSISKDLNEKLEQKEDNQAIKCTAINSANDFDQQIEYELGEETPHDKMGNSPKEVVA